MQNHKKQDSISVNLITPPDDAKTISKKPVGNAGEDPFCLFNHQRYAVDSVIKNRDGSETVCTEDGSWQNK